jgi:hypothetical protein
VVRVEDERLRRLELVLEHAREALVPALRHARRLLHGLFFGGIEVDVEVRSLEDAEAEVVVLDFVASEVLRLGLLRERDGRQQRQ